MEMKTERGPTSANIPICVGVSLASKMGRGADLVDGGDDGVYNLALEGTVHDGGVVDLKLCAALDDLGALGLLVGEDGNDVPEPAGAGALHGLVESCDEVLGEGGREVGRMEGDGLRESLDEEHGTSEEAARRRGRFGRCQGRLVLSCTASSYPHTTRTLLHGDAAPSRITRILTVVQQHSSREFSSPPLARASAYIGKDDSLAQ